MTGSELIRAIWDNTDRNYQSGRDFRRGLLEGMREVLRGEGEYVLESADELRSTALAETDLVEPNYDRHEG